MPEPILYVFKSEGHGDVVSALRSVTSAAQESSRALGGMGIASSRSARQQETEFRRAVAAANKAGQEQERAATAFERAQERRLKSAQKASDKIVKEFQREAAEAQKAADKIARAHEKARESASRIALGVLGGIGGGILASGLSAITGLIGSAFHTGAQLVGGAVRESWQTQDLANRVSINARMPGQAAVDPTALRKEFERTAIATPGQSAEDVGKGVLAFVNLTGKLQMARESMQDFATAASAGGTSVEKVAETVASLDKQFKLDNSEKVRQVLAALVAQCKGGAVTVDQFAREFRKVGSAAASFGEGTGAEAVARVGALVQLTATTTKSTQTAGTAVAQFYRVLGSKQKQIKAAGGFDVYDKQGNAMHGEEAAARAIASFGGEDIAKKTALINKVFGGRASDVVHAVMPEALEAGKGKHGKDYEKAVYEAALAAYKRASEQTSAWAEVQQDAAQAQRSASAQLAMAWEQLKSVAGERLAPKLAELATRLAGDGKVLDMFIAAVGVAASSLEALAAALQSLGFISGGTSEEKSAEASKAAGETKKRLDALGAYEKLSPEKRAEYSVLNAQYMKQQAIAEDEGRKAAMMKAAQEQIEAGGGSATATAAYGQLGGTTAHTVAKVAGMLPAFMAPMLAGAMPSVTEALPRSNFLHGLAGESLEQRGVRNAAEAKGDSVTAGGQDLIRAAAELTAAAQKIAAASNAQGSITGKPVAPGAHH